MANVKIGHFMQPRNHSDVVDSKTVTPVVIGKPYEAPGVPEPGNQPVPALSVPSPIPPITPPPKLGHPANLPAIPPFTPHPTHPADPQPSQMPQIPPFEDGTLEPGEQPVPPLSTVATMYPQPAPPLSTPAKLPPQPAPVLSAPSKLPPPPSFAETTYSGSLPHAGFQDPFSAPTGTPLSIDQRPDNGNENRTFDQSFREVPRFQYQTALGFEGDPSNKERPTQVRTLGGSRMLERVPRSDAASDPYARVDGATRTTRMGISPNHDSTQVTMDIDKGPNDVNWRAFQEKLNSADSTVHQMLNDIGVYQNPAQKIGDDYSFGTTNAGGPTNVLGAPGGHNWDPLLVGKHLARLGRAIGKTGIALFLAQNEALYLLNRHGNVINPSVIAGLPIISDFVPSPIDILITGGYSTTHGGGTTQIDVHKQLQDGVYSEIQGIADAPFVKQVTAAGLVKLPGIGGILSIDSDMEAQSQKDGLLTSAERLTTVGQKIFDASRRSRNFNLDTSPRESELGGQQSEAFLRDLNKTGVDRKTDGVAGNDVLRKRDSLSSVFSSLPSTIQIIDTRSDPLFASFAASAGGAGLIRASFVSKAGSDFDSIDGKKGGFFKSSGKDGDLPDDDAAYLPLVFTDLRPISGNALRVVYFRPFITSLTEEFSPAWNMQRFFGRVDPVATYQATNRIVSISFKIIAEAPADLKLIYQKLAWLTSMVYPLYDDDLAMKAAPVVRMRVGDLISGKRAIAGDISGKGLPGVITSLNIDYGEATWELEKDKKLPRNFTVSLGFHVLHDGAVGLASMGSDQGTADTFGSVSLVDVNGKTKAKADIREFRRSFGDEDYVNPDDAQPTVQPKTQTAS